MAAILLVVAVIGLIICQQVYRNHHRHDKPAVMQSGAYESSSNKDTVKACTIFTLADARQLLGTTAKGGASNSNTSSKDLDTSLCVYSPDATAAVPAKTASLLVRAPKTPSGGDSNQRQFSQLKPADVQSVAGYGDDAYWDPQYGQLNILKDNTWYILTFGSPEPANHTLDQTKQMADIVIVKI